MTAVLPEAEIARAVSAPGWSRRLLVHTGFAFGAAVLLIMAAMALPAPLLAPWDPYDQDLARRLIGPCR